MSNTHIANINHIRLLCSVFSNYEPNVDDHKAVESFVKFWWNNKSFVAPADIVFFLKDKFDVDLHEYDVVPPEVKIKGPKKRLIKVVSKEEKDYQDIKKKRAYVKCLNRRYRNFDRCARQEELGH